MSAFGVKTTVIIDCFVYVIAWARVQLVINFTCIFKFLQN